MTTSSSRIPEGLVDLARSQGLIAPNAKILTGNATSWLVVGAPTAEGTMAPHVLLCTAGPRPAPGLPPTACVLSLFSLEQFAKLAGAAAYTLETLGVPVASPVNLPRLLPASAVQPGPEQGTDRQPEEEAPQAPRGCVP